MIRGSCLCGGIRIEADKVPLITNCHCSKCRKRHGSAFQSGASVPLSEFRFIRGEDLIDRYQTPSGYTSSFCRVCGSGAPLIFEEEELVSIPAGLFDDDPEVRPALHMFVGSKAHWWEITDELPQFEEWVPGYGPDEQS